MKNTLLFDFTVDKATNTVYVKREFAADQDLVWDAFTKQEILDQWWAPKPWTSKTKHMNFENGGRRFYAMCGPEGQEHWSVQEFDDINPPKSFKMTSAFTDKDENTTSDSPGSVWHLDFSEADGVTTVSIAIKHKTWATLEQMIKMGFKEGFTMTLNYLVQLLNDLKK
jgi:uncharacterized protein YndB with AHSA1/START domain